MNVITTLVLAYVHHTTPFELEDFSTKLYNAKLKFVILLNISLLVFFFFAIPFHFSLPVSCLLRFAPHASLSLPVYIKTQFKGLSDTLWELCEYFPKCCISCNNTLFGSIEQMQQMISQIFFISILTDEHCQPE